MARSLIAAQILTYPLRLIKVSDTYLEPSQTSMMGNFFAKIVNGFRKKAPSEIRDWVTNTPLSKLRSQESGTFCLPHYITLCSSVIKCSPFHQK